MRSPVSPLPAPLRDLGRKLVADFKHNGVDFLLELMRIEGDIWEEELATIGKSHLVDQEFYVMKFDDIENKLFETNYENTGKLGNAVFSLSGVLTAYLEECINNYGPEMVLALPNDNRLLLWYKRICRSVKVAGYRTDFVATPEHKKSSEIVFIEKV